MNAEPLMEARGLVPTGGFARPGLDLHLNAGEIVCLVGRDETLLSSWLEALAGVEPPVDGELLLDQRDAWHLSREEWRTTRQRFGFIGERTVLVSTLDGLTNVMLPALYHGRGRAGEIEERAVRLISRFGLGEDCRRLPAYLQPGQRRRLLLARCLLLDPVALFVDEPFSLGYVGSWEETTRRANWLAREQGIGLVVATRNMHFVRRHGDRIVLVEKPDARVFERFDELVAAADQSDEVRALIEAAETGTQT